MVLQKLKAEGGMSRANSKRSFPLLAGWESETQLAKARRPFHARRANDLCINNPSLLCHISIGHNPFEFHCSLSSTSFVRKTTP